MKKVVAIAPDGPILPSELIPYGLAQAVIESYDRHHVADGQLARVVRVDRGMCVVATGGGLAECHIGSDPPVTGDWAVCVNTSDGGLRLHAVLPRTTVVRRLSAMADGVQALAANVDTMFILHGIDRPHRVGRLQRLAILSWDAGVRPVIVLTKIDLAGGDGAVIGVDDAIVEILEVVQDIEVIPTSSATGAGIDRLWPFLAQGQTVGLVGESGAGKSTLVNRLVGDEVQATGATRSGDHKGRHTTTSRDLVPVPGGGVLIDTPGLRSVSMPAATDGLARAYEDLDDLLHSCRFRDCAHAREPGCAVKAALADGSLSAERWAGYLKLQREMAFEARRATARAQRSESRDSRTRRRRRVEGDKW